MVFHIGSSNGSKRVTTQANYNIVHMNIMLFLTGKHEVYNTVSHKYTKYIIPSLTKYELYNTVSHKNMKYIIPSLTKTRSIK